MKDVKGKVAVVTGAASGIGRGMAESFAAAGMKLVLADVDADRLAQVARELEKTGAEVLPVKTDVSRQVEVDELARRALDAFGAVHVVCNNAGVAHGGVPTWESTLHDWEWIVGVNLMGVVHGVRAFTPLLLEQGEGHIVNTASMAGLISGGGNALYGVTKHAVVALSEALFNELARAESVARARLGAVSRLDQHADPAVVAAQSARGGAPPPAAGPHQPGSGDPPQDGRVACSRAASIRAASADLVLDAIRAERFWILTHPQWKSMIRHRMENVLEERDPTPAGPRPAAARPTRAPAQCGTGIGCGGGSAANAGLRRRAARQREHVEQRRVGEHLARRPTSRSGVPWMPCSARPGDVVLQLLLGLGRAQARLELGARHVALPPARTASTR